MNCIVVKNLNSLVHKNLDWTLKKDEIHGIIGHSGEGKSSLMNILLGLMPYESGTILNSKNEKWDLENQRVGVQFQSSGLFNNLTIGQNVMMPLMMNLNMPLDYAKTIVLDYINKFSLDESIFEKYPTECSGGMQKKVALIRALVLEPDILFLDEPTAGLDCMAVESYDMLIKSLENISIVMITHDLARLVKIANIISIMIKGKIYTDSFANLLKSDNIEIRKFIESYVRTNSII